MRGLIDRVVLTASPTGRGLEIELVGEIGAMVRLGTAERLRPAAALATTGDDLFSCSVKVVAGVGFEPTTFRL